MDHVLDPADRRFKAMRSTRARQRRGAVTAAALRGSDRTPASTLPAEPAPDRHVADPQVAFESSALTVLFALQRFNVHR